jgi:hypothetical protein
MKAASGERRSMETHERPTGGCVNAGRYLEVRT